MHTRQTSGRTHRTVSLAPVTDDELTVLARTPETLSTPLVVRTLAVVVTDLAFGRRAVGDRSVLGLPLDQRPERERYRDADQEYQ